MFLSWHHKCVIYIKNNFKNCIKHKYTTLPLRNIKGITKGIVTLYYWIIGILYQNSWKILFINIESPMNCDMIYDFYSVSCEFSLSPSLGEGIENTQEVR